MNFEADGAEFDTAWLKSLVWCIESEWYNIIYRSGSTWVRCSMGMLHEGLTGSCSEKELRPFKM
jgi:hypothetical protein